MVQARLAREVPAVGARRLQVAKDIERVIAGALEAELGHGRHIAARLAAASLMAALDIAEESAVAQMEQQERALDPDRGDAPPRRRRHVRRGRHGGRHRPLATPQSWLMRSMHTAEAMISASSSPGATSIP